MAEPRESQEQRRDGESGIRLPEVFLHCALFLVAIGVFAAAAAKHW
jgi:hypothetical protein